MVPGIVRGTSTVNALQVPDGLFRLRAEGASDELATIYAFLAGGTRYELWSDLQSLQCRPFERLLETVWRNPDRVHWRMDGGTCSQSESKHLVKLEIGPTSPGFPGHAHWEVVASLTLKIGEPNGDFRTAGLYGYGAWIRDPNSQSNTEYKFAYVVIGDVGFPPPVDLQRVLMTEVRVGGSNVGEWLVSLGSELPSNPRYFTETAALP
jgi:hypothetical protein